MNLEQMEHFRAAMAVPDGAEWDPAAGLDLPAAELAAFLAAVPFNAAGTRRPVAPQVPVPPALPGPRGAEMSAPGGFGRLLHDLAARGRPPAPPLVTAAPPVTVSTH